MIKAHDSDWGSPTDQDRCDCGATDTTNGQCQDCADEYEATIDWERR